MVARAPNLHLRFPVLTDRSVATVDKRQQLLDAAVRVFARAGYHTSRVGDIAEEAGVAHGLLYHYFASKQEVLETIFRENWRQLLERFHEVEASPEPSGEQLRAVAKILLRTWRNNPDLVELPLEVLAARDLAHHHAHQVGIVPPGTEQDLGHASELLLGRLRRRLDLVEALEQLAPVLAEDRREDLLLGGEVVVQQPVGDPCLLGDVADA